MSDTRYWEREAAEIAERLRNRDAVSEEVGAKAGTLLAEGKPMEALELVLRSKRR